MSVVDAPDTEPCEVVATVAQGRTSSNDVDSARASVDEGDPNLARGLMSDENGQIRLAITVEIAPLVERVDAIIPLVLRLELSAQDLDSPPGHVPASIDGEWIPRLCRKTARERGERRCSNQGSQGAHSQVVAPPNGSRLSCGALTKDSFLNLRAPSASSAC